MSASTTSALAAPVSAPPCSNRSCQAPRATMCARALARRALTGSAMVRRATDACTLTRPKNKRRALPSTETTMCVCALMLDGPFADQSLPFLSCSLVHPSLLWVLSLLRLPWWWALLLLPSYDHGVRMLRPLRLMSPSSRQRDSFPSHETHFACLKPTRCFGISESRVNPSRAALTRSEAGFSQVGASTPNNPIVF
jgi:hypothetical protein